MNVSLTSTGPLNRSSLPVVATPRTRRAARFVAASTAIAGLVATPMLLAISAGTVFAQQETPAQRCARETATYNQTMESAWRAANPGKTPPAGAWPAYVCKELPEVELPPVDGGGATGGNSTSGNSGASTPGRDHQYEGFGNSNPYEQDMQVGGTRGGLSARIGSGASTSATSAADSARSNVPHVPAWATPREVTVVDDGGQSRQVRVIDTDAGVAVITDDGVATGEVIDNSDGDGKGGPSLRDVEGLEGANLLDQLEETDNPTEDGDQQGPSPVAPGPLGAMAAAAGGIGVLTNRRRRSGTPSSIRPAVSSTSTRPGAAAPSLPTAPTLTTPQLNNVPGIDGSPRVTINHLNGAEQTIFALLSPQSNHDQEFDLNVPDGADAIIRTDGGVDVVDAQGNVVRQVDPPWAYDALGRPQKTWYTYDPTTGVLTQHVEPNANAVYPIIADPNNRAQAATPKSTTVSGVGIEGGDGEYSFTDLTIDNSYLRAHKPPKPGGVDLSDYGSRSDERDLGGFNRSTPAQQVRTNASITIEALEIKYDSPNAADLQRHYMGNTGEPYYLDEAVVDGWIIATEHEYPDSEVRSPAFKLMSDRMDAINEAGRLAREEGRPVKYTYTSPWAVVASDDPDAVRSVGRFSLSSTTTVIVTPLDDGHYDLKWSQVAHVFDITNFAYNSESSGPIDGLKSAAIDSIKQGSINNLRYAEELGIGKPFEVHGTSSPITGQQYI